MGFFYDIGFDEADNDLAQLKAMTFVTGIVIGVDSQKGTIDVTYRKLGKVIKKGIPINFGTFGSFSGIRVMPKYGDLVLLGLNADGSIIHLGAIGYQYDQLVEKENDLSSTYKMTHVKPGEFHLQAASGNGPEDHPKPLGYIHGNLNGDIILKDGKLNVMELNAKEGEIFKKVDTERHKGYNVRVSRGIVKRTRPSSSGIPQNQPLALNGVPAENGVPPISESRIKVGQQTDPNGNDMGKPSVEMVAAEQVLDEDGIPEFNTGLSPLTYKIETKDGGKIAIDNKGIVEINKGNQIGIKDSAARENDITEVPITPAYNDANHPKQTQNALENYSALQQLAAMFMSPMGPCTFIPTGSNVKLKSTITTGSKKTFIG